MRLAQPGKCRRTNRWCLSKTELGHLIAHGHEGNGKAGKQRTLGVCSAFRDFDFWGLDLSLHRSSCQWGETVCSDDRPDNLWKCPRHDSSTSSSRSNVFIAHWPGGTPTDCSCFAVQPIFQPRFGHGRLAKVDRKPGPDFRLAFDGCVQASQNGAGRALAARLAPGSSAQARTIFARFSVFSATTGPPSAKAIETLASTAARRRLVSCLLSVVCC